MGYHEDGCEETELALDRTDAELEGALAEVAQDELIIIDLRQRVGVLTTELASYREGHARAEQHLRDLLTVNESLLGQRVHLTARRDELLAELAYVREGREAYRAEVAFMSESLDQLRSHAMAGHAEAEHWHRIAAQLATDFCGVRGEAGSVDPPYYYREAG